MKIIGYELEHNLTGLGNCVIVKISNSFAPPPFEAWLPYHYYKISVSHVFGSFLSQLVQNAFSTFFSTSCVVHLAHSITIPLSGV